MEHELHPHDLESHTVAWFGSPDQVRSAAVELERRGIDSMYIDVSRTPSPEDRRRIDRSSMSWLGRRALVGAAAGLVLGVLIGLGLGALLGAAGMELVGTAVAVAVFTAPIGGFLSVVTRLPVTDEAFDTFASVEPEDDWISVAGPDEVQETARSVLDELEPLHLSPAGQR